MSIVAAPGRDDDGDDLSSDRLINARQFARMLQVSLRTLWRLVSAGKAPQPIKLNGNTRWLKSAVLAWLKAGCPPQSKELTNDIDG
jgi:predicted DNA-binding transcriptional regulator AlpA